LALPIGFLLLPVQASAIAYEVVAKQSLGHRRLLIGARSGLGAGLVWYLFLASSKSNAWMPWALGGLGAFQALVVFGCHWLACRMELHGVGETRGKSVVT
jgi:hypothetical protein